MEDTIYINGRACERYRHFGKPYLRERIRTEGYRAQAVEHHIRRLASVAESLYGERENLSAEAIQREVDQLLRGGHYSASACHIVELRTYGAGHYSLHVVETSFYDRFGLRAIRPIARLTREPIPFNGAPTSAYAELVEHLRRTVNAAREDGDSRNAVPVNIDHEGCVTSIDGCTPIAVKGREIIFAPTLDDPYTEQLLALCRRLRGGQIVVRPLMENELDALDELMYVDARGITSVAECGRAVYADIIANVLDRAMEQE